MSYLTRRETLAALFGTALAARVRADTRTEAERMLTRPIPASKEALPVIGMGTWQTFDVGDAAGERAPLVETLRAFFDAGGTVIDSSPMYGRAEGVVGDVLRELPKARPFLCTKVWTTGKDEGIRQMNESFRRMGTKVMDLMQVHNLVDWKTHLATMRAWKKEGRIRYLGVTHYRLDAFDELEKIVAREGIDFVQLPYSLQNRAAEKSLLPAAAANGVAVLVMQPFEKGGLFGKVKGKELPAYAREAGIGSWAQLFLKWILGHPAVTCPIPATSDPKHMADNMHAGVGAVMDEGMRKKVVADLGL